MLCRSREHTLERRSAITTKGKCTEGSGITKSGSCSTIQLIAEETLGLHKIHGMGNVA